MKNPNERYQGPKEDVYGFVRYLLTGVAFRLSLQLYGTAAAAAAAKKITA